MRREIGSLIAISKTKSSVPRFPQLTLLMTSLFLMLGGDRADQAGRRVSPRGGARHSQLMESGPDKVSPTLGINNNTGDNTECLTQGEIRERGLSGKWAAEK